MNNSYHLIDNIVEYNKDPVIKSLNDMALKIKSLSIPISIEYSKGTVKYTYEESYYEVLARIDEVRNNHIDLYYTPIKKV